MAYNKINKLLMYKKVVDLVNQHYEEGFTTYAGVWRTYINPVYPMSYQTFIQIINMPNLDKVLQDEYDKLNKEESECLKRDFGFCGESYFDK